MGDPRLGDKSWRVANLYKIKNKHAQLVTFKRNRAQADFNEKKHTRNIVLKSRQLGFTTDECIDMLDDVLFTKNFDALFIAQDLDTAKDVFSRKIDVAWKNFPLRDLYKMNNESARQLKFDFGDGTVSSLTVDSTGRAGTFSRVHISEFAPLCQAYPERAKDILDGTIPAVPMNARIDIESTAKGEVGDFHDMFWTAWNRGEPEHPTQFKAHFYNWTWDDAEIGLVTEPIKNLPHEFLEYQKQHSLTDQEISYYFLKWQSLSENWTQLHTNYPTTPEEAFTYSGNKLFEISRIAEMKKEAIKPKKAGDWSYFKEARVGHRYGMGVDVAEGVGQDSSTIVVWDFTPLKPEVVATYKSNQIAPDLLAYEVKNGGEKYQMATVAVEKNNHGHATLAKLLEIYPQRCVWKDDRGRYGFQTNLATKPKILYDLNTAVNDDLVYIPDLSLINEMQIYDKEEMQSNRFDAEATQHFDLLMAAAIGFFLKSQLAQDKTSAKQYKPSFLNRMVKKR